MGAREEGERERERMGDWKIMIERQRYREKREREWKRDKRKLRE